MAYTQSFNVEFDDTLLSYQSHTNPRHNGSKLVAKEVPVEEINKWLEGYGHYRPESIMAPY